MAVARALAGGQRGCVHLLRPLPQDDRASRVLAAQEPSEDALSRFEGNEAGIEVRTMSFVSQRPARDLCDLADAKEAGVIVLGSHGPPKAAVARGVVREVLDAATCPVAVLVGGAFPSSPRRVLVLGPNRPGFAGSLAHVASLARDGFAEHLCSAPDPRRALALLE